VKKMEIGLVKISTKGQIVIPNNIRTKLGLVKDEQLMVMSEDNEIIIKPIKDVLNIKKKKSKYAEDFVRAMRHDKILTEMEKGKELKAEDVLR